MKIDSGDQGGRVEETSVPWPGMGIVWDGDTGTGYGQGEPLRQI